VEQQPVHLVRSVAVELDADELGVGKTENAAVAGQ